MKKEELTNPIGTRYPQSLYEEALNNLSATPFETFSELVRYSVEKVLNEVIDHPEVKDFKETIRKLGK